MVTRPEPRTPTLALALLLSSLLACKMFKKGEDETLPTVPSTTAAPTVTQAAAPPPKEEPKPVDAPLKLGDVKRFADKEKKVEGVVKVLEADVKVFNEPDVKAPHVAALNKNIFVSRLATLDDFVLVEFPSGVGELSPGWVLLAQVVQWCTENGRHEFDFMRGDEDYKYRFGGVNKYVMRAKVILSLD